MKNSAFLTVCMNPTIQKILVFDDLVSDTVNRTNKYRMDPSGKGINVSRVLKQLGKDAVHLCQLGGELRPLFLDLCEAEDIKIKWVESNSPIRFCYTVINKNDKSVTELVEESHKVDEGTGKRLLDEYSKIIGDFSTVTISGTMAAGFPSSLIPDMTRIAKEKDVRVILDLRGQDLINSLPYYPDLIKPNLYEFATTFAPELVYRNEINPEIKDLKERIEKIIEKNIIDKFNDNPVSLVLSRGTKPVWYWDSAIKKLEEYSFEKVEPVNTTGSGDAFTAGIAACLDEGASLGEAIISGVKCGALNTAQISPGIIPPS